MSVNVAEITALADYLEALPDERFDMAYYARETECGTVACIAGHDVVRRGGSVKFNSWGKFDFLIDGERVFAADDAGEALGLTENQADALFSPNLPFACARANPGDHRHISRRRGIAALRDMVRRESGDVDWSIREPEAAA